MTSTWISIGLLAAASFIAACGNGDDNSDPVPSLDATVGDVDVVASPASLRVANWAPDLTSAAVDVCLSLPGLQSFAGPVLGGGAISFLGEGGTATSTLGVSGGNTDGSSGGDAGLSGVPYGQISSYVSIPPGPYDLRFVAAGALDCSQPIAPDLLNAGNFGSATLTTVAIFGRQNADPGSPLDSLSVMAIVDDATIAGNAKASLRFINALPELTEPDGTTLVAPTIDFGTGVTSDAGSMTTFKPLYIGVPFGGVSDKTETQVSTQSATASVDSHGYGSVGPYAQQRFSAHRSGTLFDVAGTQTDIAGGAIVTVVLLPLPCGATDGGCGNQAELAFYVDNAAFTGSLAPCLTCVEAGTP